MPPGKAACRSVLRYTQPVWITDDVLADAFHRFLNASNAGRKRFGSNVPGPLEARRRASKRHMIGLATIGPSIGPDFGALFGADKPGPPAWTWEAPTMGKQPREDVSLEMPPPSTLSRWLPSLEPAHVEEPCRTTDRLGRFTTRLCDIRNTSELERIWSESGLGPGFALELSRKANHHFMDNLETEGIGPSPYFAFLRNPRLNISGARNILSFVSWATSNQIPISLLGPLINTIEGALRLGNISTPELLLILDSVPDLCAKVCKDRGSADRWEFKFYWAVWKGLKSCKLWPIQEVDKAVIRKMVERISVLQQTPDVFMWKVRRSGAQLSKRGRVWLQPLPKDSEQPDALLFRLEIYSHLWPIEGQAKPGDYAAHLAFWTRKLAKLEAHGISQEPLGLSWNTLKSLLNSMDAMEAELAIADTTSVLLVSDSRAGADLGQNLRSWLNCISQTRHMDPSPEAHRDVNTKGFLFADLLDLVLTRNPRLLDGLDPVHASSYFRDSSADKFVQVWMRHWVPKYMAEDCLTVAKNWRARNERVMQDYKKRLRKLNYEPYHPFYAAICALRNGRLPCRRAQAEAMALTLAMFGPQAVAGLYQLFEQAKLHCNDTATLAAAVNATCPTNAVLALKYYKTFSRLPLRLCHSLPLALIEQNHLSGDEFIAMFSRRYRDNIPPATDPAPPTRAEIVHFAAYAYANQSHRHPRQRFRNVHACYCYLRDNALPLQPLMSTALVHAGVIAALENNIWVSTQRLGWILALVSHLEGPDVAAQLDRLVWDWRGRVIARARDRWDAAGLFRARGPSTVTAAHREGLFAGVPLVPSMAPRLNVPRPAASGAWLTRWWYRKYVKGDVGFRTARAARRARFGGYATGLGVWGRFQRRWGGRDGHLRPYSPFSPKGGRR